MAATIDGWLKDTSEMLADAMIPSAGLDAELILSHTLNQHRTWLHAHGEEPIDSRYQDILDARVQLRLERVPVAYIVGHKEFYGRLFRVTPSVLVPRPESESLVSLVLKNCNYSSSLTIVDVGTGSGCLGITLALELPNSSVTLCDNDPKALAVAKQNANLHHAKLRVVQSDLLKKYPLRADIIVANLPYVDRSWEVSAETNYEPPQALFAEDGGLALIEELIEQAPSRMNSGGRLVLEADPRQHDNIIKQAKPRGLSIQQTDGFGLLFSLN